MVPQIAISYRRSDSQDITGRIFDRLRERFGRDSVFRDIDNIRPGIDFRVQISEALQTTDVLLVIVGPKWFGRAKGEGARINNEADPVRIEVETALQRDIPVIPVLVGNARMPTTAQLPDSLKDFAYRHAVTVDGGRDFDHHLAGLIRALERILEDKVGLAKAKPASDEQPIQTTQSPAVPINRVDSVEPPAASRQAAIPEPDKSPSSPSNALLRLIRSERSIGRFLRGGLIVLVAMGGLAVSMKLGGMTEHIEALGFSYSRKAATAGPTITAAPANLPPPAAPSPASRSQAAGSDQPNQRVATQNTASTNDTSAKSPDNAGNAPSKAAIGAARPFSADRIALVVGNAKYPDADGPLRSVVNDANDVTDELRRDGFNVEVGINLTGDAMHDALDRLYGKIKPGCVALVFFSGFGVQSDRQTYLIPVDAQIWNEADVRRDGVSLDRVLGDIVRRGAAVKIVLVDASRRNPFERRFRSYSGGLAPLAAPNGSLVMYSAALSSIVPDSGDDHSLFVQELLKQVRAPGLTIEEALNRTRVGVTRASNSEQIPWISSSLATDFGLTQR